MILNIAIGLFILLESLNIILLYFKPNFKYGNSMYAFKEYDDFDKNSDDFLLVDYLVNWVAGTKLIFIGLLLVILIYGNDNIKVLSLIILILTVSSYFFRLSKIIKKMDKKNLIQPKGYYKILNSMILSFILFFIIAIIIYYI